MKYEVETIYAVEVTYMVLNTSHLVGFGEAVELAGSENETGVIQLTVTDQDNIVELAQSKLPEEVDALVTNVKILGVLKDRNNG